MQSSAIEPHYQLASPCPNVGRPLAAPSLKARLSPSALVAAALLLLALLVRLLGQSLRNFGRSRLQELCEDRGQPLRFGEILQGDEAATRICEALAALLLTSGLIVAAHAAGWIAIAEPPADAWPVQVAAGLILLVAGYLTFITLPWSLSQAIAEPLLVRVWPIVKGLLVVCRPLTRMTELVTLFLRRLLDRPADRGQADHISDEIASVVDEGARTGTLESGAAEMIEAVVDLKRRDVLDVMRPRTDIVFMPGTLTLAEGRQLFIDAGHSRIPVHGETQDEILGVALAKDFLHLAVAEIPTDETQTVASREDLLREPVYVPETSRVDALLEQMRENRFHLALVLDEYGGVTGLVTLEDILEEIIGDIADETDRVEQEVLWVCGDDGSVDVEGRAHLDDLNSEFDYGLPDDGDFDSIGGLVLKTLNRVPEIGESIDVNGLRIEVLDADKRRVNRVRVSGER